MTEEWQGITVFFTGDERHYNHNLQHNYYVNTPQGTYQVTTTPEDVKASTGVLRHWNNQD
jgi:hypothetical protein